MVTAAEVKALVERGIPGSIAQVREYKPDHFNIDVASREFRGKQLVEQHRMVHKALEGLLGAELHAVAIKTREE